MQAIQLGHTGIEEQAVVAAVLSGVIFQAAQLGVSLFQIAVQSRELQLQLTDLVHFPRFFRSGACSTACCIQYLIHESHKISTSLYFMRSA